MSLPLYKSIYNDIKEKIVNNIYKVGDKLPSDSELSEHYNVSAITIKKAMDLLKEDSLISRKPRKGTIVISNEIQNHQIQANNSKLPVIGFIITNFDDIFGTDILRNLLIQSQGRAQIIMKITLGDSELEAELLDELVSLGVDGIILLPASSEFISPKLLELVSKNFPLVLIDRQMDKLPTCSVGINNSQAAQLLTEYLFDNGHEKIGIVTATPQVSTIQERIDGVIAAHIKNHKTINQNQILSNLESMIPNSKSTKEDDIEKIKAFLKSSNNITAIFTGEFTIAVLVVQALKELNQEIKKDFSLVCFDHTKYNMLNNQEFTFTHIVQDQYEIGKKALDLILRKIEQPTLIEKNNAPYYLVEGQSVKKI
ncbi:GntR family transcriptional regulator [Fundicoccus culcitae]|uniref:GntR family transcriptional regulator n=1 Tax=Fundicoccus culcitae TaxID=2969821 RepID=A0ABY5P8G8_9LACT|nr:GntR family transcriptional regulator [Fundicoccus culcitae]UUX35042.1 GntR family transcriptional regulator [Fundicoccus culcitae]